MDITAKFQSTRPIRGATGLVHGAPLDLVISIHAPHTGRDFRRLWRKLCLAISIHAPHTGRDSHLVPCTGSTP